MSFLASTAQNYLRYSDGLEEIDPKEIQTFQEINELMSKGADTVREKYHRPLRISHAKAHGAVRGKLIVNSDLADYLRQGLFATPGKEYDVIIRLAHTPGELLDDRKVSTPRGFSIKVLNVEGEQLNFSGSDGGATQDFVFDTGKAFIAPNAAVFHQAFKPNAEIAPHLSDTTKGVVSSISRGTNKVLNAIGLDSGKLDFFGHPFLHPLAEYYYSQVPSRYGEYVAKFSVEPNTPGLQALKDKEFEPQDENGLRTDVVVAAHARCGICIWRAACHGSRHHAHRGCYCGVAGGCIAIPAGRTHRDPGAGRVQRGQGRLRGEAVVQPCTYAVGASPAGLAESRTLACVHRAGDKAPQ